MMSEQKFSKLRIFLSWSGVRSKAIAQVFREWLPSVLQNVQPYFTPDDIEKGARWSGEIRGQLEATDFGVIFLTPENINAPWILFEAGALSKLDTSRVAPLLLGIEPAEVSGPLSQLQLTRFDRDECFKLLAGINRGLGEMGLDTTVLDTVFGRAWPELEEKVKAALAIAPANQSVPKRPERDMLEELLERMRALETRATVPAAHNVVRVMRGSDITNAPVHVYPTDFDFRNVQANEITIDDVPLTERARQLLKSMGVVALIDILQYSEVDLLKTPNFGRKAVNDVRDMLAKYGLRLRET
jgi:hypothetical protein